MTHIVKVKDKSEYDAIVNETDVRCDIKIGGKDEEVGSKFVPHINMSKWNGECWLNINHPDKVLDEKEVFEKSKIEIGIGDKIHRYYVLNENDLEYEIEFKEKPVIMS